MSFEKELSKGTFCIPECIICKRMVWPPADFCSHCLGQASLRQGEFEGKIVEFSSKDTGYFCVVEIEKEIRIMARTSEIPKIGQKVKITKCGIKDGNYFFDIS